MPMFSKILVVGALLGVGGLLSPSCSHAADVPASVLPLLQAKGDIIRELAKPISRCVARQDTDHVAFHGCIDWHSSVHGTWALMAYTRASGDRQYALLIDKALEAENIEAERQFLHERPNFEMPYGRAWFLRLAIEEHFYAKEPKLKAMADEVLASMLAYFRRAGVDPNSTDYKSASWALINMYDYARVYHHEAAEKEIKEWIIAKFARPDAQCDLSLEHTSFMAVCTNWAWLTSLVMERDAYSHWLNAFFRQSGLPKPVETPIGWHNYGLNFSRAWGLWQIYSATGEPKYAELYAAHFKTGYDTPSNWRGSYEGVAHWVAQFGMFAMRPHFEGGRRP